MTHVIKLAVMLYSTHRKGPKRTVAIHNRNNYCRQEGHKVQEKCSNVPIDERSRSGRKNLASFEKRFRTHDDLLKNLFF
jgi:hypothetical protein